MTDNTDSINPDEVGFIDSDSASSEDDSQPIDTLSDFALVSVRKYCGNHPEVVRAIEALVDEQEHVQGQLRDYQERLEQSRRAHQALQMQCDEARISEAKYASLLRTSVHDCQVDEQCEHELLEVAERLRAENAELASQAHALRDENKLLREEVAQLLNDNDELKNDEAKASAERWTLCNERRDIQQTADQLSEENERLIEENSLLCSRVCNLKEKQQHLEEDIASARVEENALTRRLAQVEQEYEKLSFHTEKEISKVTE